MSGSSSLATGG